MRLTYYKRIANKIDDMLVAAYNVGLMPSTIILTEAEFDLLLEEGSDRLNVTLQNDDPRTAQYMYNNILVQLEKSATEDDIEERRRYC